MPPLASPVKSAPAGDQDCRKVKGCRNSDFLLSQPGTQSDPKLSLYEKHPALERRKSEFYVKGRYHSPCPLPGGTGFAQEDAPSRGKLHLVGNPW